VRTSTLAATLTNKGVEGSIDWKSYQVSDQTLFTRYLRERVCSRVRDDDQKASFEAELLTLATTEMDTEFVNKRLNAVPDPLGWEIGEALSECLEENATRLDIQGTLLKWLRCRCLSEEHRELYRTAVRRYVTSGGKELLLVGILVRDTTPNERDFLSRTRALAKKLKKPVRVEIVAWYLPVPIEQWAGVLGGGAP